jgi:hypothetical protein
MWDAAERRELSSALARGSFPSSCSGCAHEVRLEGRASSYLANFDPFLPELSTSRVGAWPTRMEFNLSNSCNLQCLQCNGDLSSMIRLHREQRPPLEDPYDDAFFEDLREFIPHLVWAQFAGGEPFMAPANFRVWSLVEELNPGLLCIAVTNATRWNDEIRQVCERLRMGFTFSIDGVTSATYESIRVGASFEETMRNLERFCEIAGEAGTPTEVNHCLMRQNHHEFGELLLFAEERSMPVHVSVVRDPSHCSLASLPVTELRGIHEALLAEEDRVLPQLSLNAHVWRAEVDRIGRWADATEQERSEALGTWVTTVPTLIPRIMGLPRRGVGPTDDRAARAALAERSDPGALTWFSVDADDRVVEVSAGLVALLGSPADELLGGQADALGAAVLRQFGAMGSYEVIASDDDRIDAVASFAGCNVLVATVALRDGRGRADTVRVLMAVESSSAPVAPA